MKLIVTGAAGFIGFHVSKEALKRGYQVVGVDSLNDYYDQRLKRARVAALGPDFAFHKLDICDTRRLINLMDEVRPDVVVHLAAQAGVRHSFDHPMAYTNANVQGHASVLEACRLTPGLRRLVYASSSSVYGGAKTVPFTESAPLSKPKSYYAATKMAAETLSESYADLFGLDQVGLRFFTVYGPWGRPDMAYWKFADAIRNGRPLSLFNHGDIRRDFTYIDDVVETVLRIIESAAPADSLPAAHEIYNVGNHTPTEVRNMISIIERSLGKTAKINLEPLPPGDMVETFADVEKLQRDYGFAPATTLEQGMARFLDWYAAWTEQALTTEV